MQPLNIPPFIANPILGGLCTYSELLTMSIDEVADLNELLVVRAENERRAAAYAEQQSQRAARQ